MLAHALNGRQSAPGFTRNILIALSVILFLSLQVSAAFQPKIKHTNFDKAPKGLHYFEDSPVC
jgi:hypothetical protein